MAVQRYGFSAKIFVIAFYNMQRLRLEEEWEKYPGLKHVPITSVRQHVELSMPHGKGKIRHRRLLLNSVGLVDFCLACFRSSLACTTPQGVKIFGLSRLNKTRAIINFN